MRPEKDSILFLPQALIEKRLTSPLECEGGDLRSGVAAAISAISLPQVESLEMPMRRLGCEGRTNACEDEADTERSQSPAVLVGTARSILTWGQCHLCTFPLCKPRDPCVV